jgi:hypothetical protein
MTVVQPSDAMAEALAGVGATMTEEWLARAGDAGAAVIATYRGE